MTLRSSGSGSSSGVSAFSVAAEPPDPAPVAAGSGSQTAVTAFVSALLAPFVGSGPLSPSNAPLLWGVLAWVQRELKRIFSNQTPEMQDQTISLVLDPGEASDPIAFNAVDPDSPNLIFSVPGRGTVGGPSHGTVTIDQVTRSFVYLPDANFTGTDSFTVKVRDFPTLFPSFHAWGGLFKPDMGHSDTATFTP